MTMGSMNGKYLEVDLTDGDIGERSLDINLIESYLGSRGINAKILWEDTDEKTEPLSPRNIIIISAGTLAGTGAPVGRLTVTTRSPATNLYLKNSVGGTLGGPLKKNGYDGIIIKGKAEAPSYLLLDNGKVEIKSADHLWGKNVRDTVKILKEELGEKTEVACIGPAGENKVKISSIMFNIYHAAARGGVGAVMGSKNLKAFCILGGNTKIELSDPKKFDEVRKEMIKRILEDSTYESLSKFGTPGLIPAVNEIGAITAYNYTKGSFEGAYELGGQYIKEKYSSRMYACERCPIGCHLFTEWEGGVSGGPEYETVLSLGIGTGVGDTEMVLKANELCNLYGLDVISTGGVIQWAMESYGKGVISDEDTGGIKLNFGNGEALIELIHKIAHREGIGDLLAEGSKIASGKVGKGSEKWAVQAKGLEMSRVDTRAAKSYALAFAVNPRGPDHLHTETLAEFGTTKEMVELIEKITGDKKYATPYTIEKRPEIVRWHEDCYAATDALGFCSFYTTFLYGVNPDNMARMFQHATGMKMDEAKIMEAGRRIVTLENCYNIRLGVARKDHRLPWRIMHDESDKKEASVNTEEELNTMLDGYFKLHDWDVKTGKPSVRVLEHLGMKDIARELAEKGLIPEK